MLPICQNKFVDLGWHTWCVIFKICSIKAVIANVTFKKHWDVSKIDELTFKPWRQEGDTIILTLEHS